MGVAVMAFAAFPKVCIQNDGLTTCDPQCWVTILVGLVAAVIAVAVYTATTEYEPVASSVEK